ncbi:MAG: ATP-binding protein [Candidatus Competibacter sp.]|nr:ATP-binding protein [Candidatus Competibacter sp.]
MTPPRRKLPIGIQTFAKIREADYYYVDKTPMAWRLTQESGYFFLSRPRRFGKSLFLDTLKELFQGNELLFRNLYIHDRWDWTQSCPVIRISFGGGVLKHLQALGEVLHQQLEEHERRHALPARYPDPRSRFRDLIARLREQTGRGVVVLVDEYDKPILDNITEPEIALALREGLRDFYSVIKDSDAHLRFVFLTGVSKFSKVSLFSGLNNLNDITVDTAYSAICGYTEADVDTVFAPELDGLDREEIRRWYNGYNWLGETVYNPFDLLLLFDKRQFRPWWFETGTPTFLVKLLAARRTWTPRLEQMHSSSTLLSTFDVDDIPTEALMFQTGYLTIASVDTMGAEGFFTLRYPNLEVRQGLNVALLSALMPDPQDSLARRRALYLMLRSGDLRGMAAELHALYAGIPHHWYDNNPIAHYEGYYASVFYSHFAALGLDIVLEDITNRGRIDMTVKFGDHIYLFEFKVVESAPEGRALRQLKDKGYAEKYRAEGLPIHLIGIEFSREKRNVVGFEMELAIERDDAP